jgi:lincosamide nucleotidyltransferase A/C/D/E
VVIRRRDAFAAAAALGRLGFARDRTAVPGLPARLVLHDPRGRQVDLHLIVHDTAGNGWQQLDDGSWGRYDADGLDAWGEIARRRVRCISPELQVKHHRHEPWTDKDRADMARLAERFDLDV